MAVALATWILGDRLDASILQHRIDAALQEKVAIITENKVWEAQAGINKAVETAISEAEQKIGAAKDQAIASAQTAADQYASDRLAREVENRIQPQLAKFAKIGTVELAAAISLPKRLVGMFNRTETTGC